MAEILKVDNLTAGYGDLRVVWDVSFSVGEGEVTALLGRNGAGKTTVLRTIIGLNPAQGGTVSYEGKDLGRRPTHSRVAAGIGFVQEGKRLIGDATVEENLRLGAFTKKWSASKLSERIDWAYDMFPILKERRRSLSAMLSGGQQQMLGIAQALMPEPRLLLVDEPSAGLAPAIVGDVLDKLVALRQTGMSVVLVEQSVDFALELASKLVVIDLGKVVFSSPAHAPGVRDAVREAYLGRSAASQVAAD